MQLYRVSWLVLLALAASLGTRAVSGSENVVEFSMRESPENDSGMEKTAMHDGSAALELNSLLGKQALPGRSEWRRKGVAALWQLCTLMSVYTHRVCLLYADYGCFCGVGGTGSHPLDAADACCQVHDNCYDRAHAQCTLTPYVVPYHYKCDVQSSSCQCTDDAESHSCRRFLCECDLALSRCLGPTTFHPENVHANQSLCY